MNRRKKRRQRVTDASSGAPDVDDGGAKGWEERALSRIRPHVRRLTEGEGPPAAGWETDTLTRLEQYFDRDEV